MLDKYSTTEIHPHLALLKQAFGCCPEGPAYAKELKAVGSGQQLGEVNAFGRQPLRN